MIRNRFAVDEYEWMEGCGMCGQTDEPFLLRAPNGTESGGKCAQCGRKLERSEFTVDAPAGEEGAYWVYRKSRGEMQEEYITECIMRGICEALQTAGVKVVDEVSAEGDRLQ